MAVFIIDVLEFIEIRHDHRKRARFPLRAGKFLQQNVKYRPSIPDACKGVTCRHCVQLPQLANREPYETANEDQACFEEPEQQDQLSRVKAFVKQYGVEYTYLIAGAPTEMWEKIPQAVNLNTWPATFFMGRDGLVKGVHAGFAAPASGKFNEQLKDEFSSTLDRLVREEGLTLAGE